MTLHRSIVVVGVTHFILSMSSTSLSVSSLRINLIIIQTTERQLQVIRDCFLMSR